MKNKKIIRIISIVLIAVIIISASTFLGVFFYRRNNPNIRYAMADKRWEEADIKKANDEISLDLKLGNDDDAINIHLSLIGERNYDKEKLACNYEMTLTYLSLDVLIADISINYDGNIYSFNLSKKEGLIDVDNINYEISRGDVENYLFFNLDKNIIYSDDDIFINKEGSFYIDGKNSFDYLINGLISILNEKTGNDFTERINEYTNFGNPRGIVTYDKKLNFVSINSLQDISIFVPWNEIDSINDNIAFPDNIKEIISQRKFVIEDVPFLGDYTIDFDQLCPRGLDLSIKISMNTQYYYK